MSDQQPPTPTSPTADPSQSTTPLLTASSDLTSPPSKRVKLDPVPLPAECAGTGRVEEAFVKAVVSADAMEVDQPVASGSGHPGMGTEKTWLLKMTWSSKAYELEVVGDDRMYDLKALVYSLTSVPPERQKILGLAKGKLPNDEVLFKTLNLPLNHKFICIGTPEEDTFKDPTRDGMGGGLGVLDDFDVSYAEQPKGTAPAEDPRNIRKIKQKVEQCTIDVMNEPRPGKRLLVLDLDYTIVDTKPLLDGSLPPAECCRPGLHEFLELVYPHYDIAVWSQTHWRWLESKLVEMGMIGDPERTYKVSFVADRTSMFPIFGTKAGKAYKHEVKPLAFLYAKFPQWSNKNTIHIDDLVRIAGDCDVCFHRETTLLTEDTSKQSRNFALNPESGLKIRAYKVAAEPGARQDTQLHKLGQYLLHLASLEDFTTIDHGEWKKWRPPFPAPGV